MNGDEETNDDGLPFPHGPLSAEPPFPGFQNRLGLGHRRIMGGAFPPLAGSGVRRLFRLFGRRCASGTALDLVSAEWAAYRQGCLHCRHNRCPGQADIDGCELGADWDDETGCPYWRWDGRLT
jgi:hypothetical protein